MMPSRGKLYLLMLRFFNTTSVAFVLLFLQQADGAKLVAGIFVG